ncbi:radical SAM protein [Myroides marinus]|uniref:B12-binding domain-containing radical SAM protein n=1 Tax=Myroides marinus TaxID=703342 RepID=UPI00257690BB|nr:radical SAM protein [Myroides marinus]MDM1345835.1 radical SAM protein [Myroides marinus]MDM1349304.1 radical SAM protein [Myroides marinus]MDM1353018.1 radical SAM protein [Myroides marinus]MDM1356514.1 radical SAM protein [Myroides marinus]MDM1360874.1 radical SAM protein [Myroides marinus]
MNTTIAFITPPFTQLNTPYPATAYIKGFLNTLNIDSYQADLGIEVILKLFSKQGLVDLFDYVHEHIEEVSPNIHRILALEEDYIATIDAVIAFLQGKNPTLAHAIVQEDYLPRASRFEQLEELEWAFGTMGIQDKAKHLSTLYLEDLSDLIVETVDTNFGFSRYAERLGRSAHTFDEMYEALQQPLTYIDEITIALLQQLIDKTNPKIIGFSVPFPGNLYSSFRCAQYIKNNHPHIKITMGGGFPNTELRSLKDVRVFEFFDFITLDDGEAPLENLILYVEGKITQEELKRTLIAKDGEVVYINNPLKRDYKQAEVGTPDYSDLPLTEYISVIEVVNPMHRMWSDGRWNKLTMAHGCYWGKCTFCDISLDYIKVYEPIAAKQIVDRMQTLIEQTGETGFHFVDEAAPPALMREVALEIIRRKLTVSWWTNIRFEKSFTKDLCLLLKASGCVAVSGGLEVASDRLLKLIDKGVTVEQVARVNRNFTEAGILVHAYLMYGFPTQTAQETIDSLEMVRQLFEAGVMQSGFWHQFAMTAHSPVGMNPEEYKVERVNAEMGTFANNDVPHVEMNGAIHDKFSYGLKKSLFNFMHGMCFDWPLNEWFDFKVPRTSISPDYIFSCLNNEPLTVCKPNQKVVWLGTFPYIEYFEKKKKNRVFEMAQLVFYTKKETIAVDVDRVVGDWFVHFVEALKEKASQTMTYQEMKKNFEEFTNEDFEPFWYSKPALALKDMALLVL